MDIAPLGHAALHMNLKPHFTVTDAIRNLHRLDSSLLESFMTRHADGLQLLAGVNTPVVVEPPTASSPACSICWSGHFRYVVVDASSRVDATTRLVCNLSETVLLVAHADVASLWSATRIQQYLGETGGTGTSPAGAEPFPQDPRISPKPMPRLRLEQSFCGRFPTSILPSRPPSIAAFR